MWCFQQDFVSCLDCNLSKPRAMWWTSIRFLPRRWWLHWYFRWRLSNCWRIIWALFDHLCLDYWMYCAMCSWSWWVCRCVLIDKWRSLSCIRYNGWKLTTIWTINGCRLWTSLYRKLSSYRISCRIFRRIGNWSFIWLRMWWAMFRNMLQCQFLWYVNVPCRNGRNGSSNCQLCWNNLLHCHRRYLH